MYKNISLKGLPGTHAQIIFDIKIPYNNKQQPRGRTERKEKQLCHSSFFPGVNSNTPQ